MSPDFTASMLRVYSRHRIKLFLLLAVLFLSSESFAINGNKVELADEEKAWLEEHPTLVVANFSSWPPFDYYENGEPRGYTVELIRLLGSKVGFGVDFVTGADWLELMEKFKAGQIDVMPSIYLTEERQAFAAFTKSYFSPPMVIVTHENNAEIGSLSELSGKRVASIVGYANTLTLQEDFPDIEVVQVADAYEGLRAVSLGNVDAFVEGIGIVSYTLDKHSIDGVKIAGDAVFGDLLNTSQRMAVAKGNVPLRNILNKALSSLSGAEKFKLHQRWLSMTSGGGVKTSQEKIKLTDSEQRWLDEHPVIRLAPHTAWAPVEWVDEEGRYSGLASSYIALIEKKLGVHFEVEKNKNWTEAVQAVKDHELDVFPSITRTLAREKYANFTQPYLSFPTVIVTLDSVEFVNGAEDLMGQKVAVVNGYESHEYLLQNHPSLDIYPQNTVADALVAVSKGEYDAFVGNIATASYTIRQKGLTNIKIAGEVVNRFDLSVGVRDDWPELVGILQKAIDSIDGKQHTEIHDKWIGIRYEHVVGYTLIWQILVVVLIIISLMYYINRKLKREVDQRKKVELELLKTNKILEEAKEMAEDANRAKSQFLSSMSHELRTPLNAVIGFAEILEIDSDALSDLHRESVGHIYDAGTHLLQLINEVLDLASIDAGKMKLSITAVKLEASFDECRAIATQLATNKGISIKFGSAENIIVKADAVRFRQALLNFISNAIKYNRKGGEVWISCCELDENRVRINVKDSGCGLTSEQAARLFQPFERLGREAGDVQGSGVGLVITKKLIESMGGSVGVVSQPGAGSIFWLELECADSDAMLVGEYSVGSDTM